MRKFIISLLALSVFVVAGRAEEPQNTPTVANWQFTSSWYFGLLPDYEVIQPIRLMDATGNDVTAQCINNVTFTSSAESSISVSKVIDGHNSGMTGYWKLKAGSTKGNATITGTYSGSTQWGQAATQGFTVFCGDPADASWAQNNMFGIDPILVYAAAGSTIEMPTITVGGSHNALTDFDILYVRSSNKNNVEVIHPAYNNAGVLLHGYQFKVKNTTATRIWIEVKGKGNYTGYWAKIYFNINGLTVSTSGSQSGGDGQKEEGATDDPNADPVIVPEGPGGGSGDTPVTPTTYSVNIPVPNYVLAAGQTIHQTPKVIKTDKDGSNVTTTDVSSYYGFTYSCDRPDYAYVAADGTVTALKEIKEPIYINVKATPTAAGTAAGYKETSTSYSIQIYSSESVIRLNPDVLTIPMTKDKETGNIVGESRLVPSIIMKVNGVVYEPNQANTYNLSYEGFDPNIVALVDSMNKVQGIDNDFNMAKVKSFKALQPGTTQGVVHAKGQGMNAGFWGTAPFSITVTPYVPSGGDTPSTSAFREISIPVPFYTMAYGNTIHQRIKVKEYANAEAKKNNQYTDVTSQYTLSYESSNTQVATVDANGVVTAVADNVNPAYIKVTASPKASGTASVSPASYGVKVLGGASIISLSQRTVTLAPNELVPLPEVFVIIDGVKYSSEDAFNLHYEVTDKTKAEVVSNEKLRGVAVGNTTATVSIVGKGAFEGFYGTAQFDITVRVSETLDGANTWYWAQDGARSSIYNLYPGKQLHFEFENKSIDANNNTGWVFVASKTPGYSDQAFLAVNPFQNYITWDGWGVHANPQPVVTLNDGEYDLATFESDLKNAHVDYKVSLGNDGTTLSINATIEAKNAQKETVRTYTYTIASKQLSYAVNVLPVYFSSVRSTIETLRLVPQTYTATAAVSGDGGKVKIMVNGQDQMDGENYKTTVTVEEGSHVVFMAIPNGNEQAGGTEGRYYFVKWSEDNSTNITRDFYIDQDISLTATFRANEKKWLEVTTDGQDYLLNKNNYDNDFFFKIKKGETVFAEGQWSEIAGLGQTLTSLYGTDNRHIDLYVRGAKAFRVYAYDSNGTESTYTVKVDNGEAATVNHHGTALETSPIFPISNTVAVGTEGETVNTITLMGDDDQLYPFIVQFFTKNIITQTDKRQHVTTADGVADDAITASTLASAGTLSSVTYANSKDSEIATVEVNNDGNLVVTGHKAGNIIVKLNFAGGDDYSNATFDYTIIVKKRDVRLSWSKKSINLHYNADPEAPEERAGEDWSQFAKLLHLTEYAADGETVIYDADAPAPAGIHVTYTSTDTNLIYFSSGTPVFCKTTGTADIIARISEDDQFLDNSASVCVNITPMGGIYYEVNTDDKPEEGKGKQGDLINGEKNPVASFDMHVYKYNDKLEAQVDKVVRTTKDIWGDVKEYQGSDAMKKVWYMDGFSNNTQGNQNAMNEHFRILEDTDEARNEYRIKFDESGADYAVVKPFSLPVRGSFVKFEALQNGKLICYALQNGNLNFNHISEYEDKKNNPLASNPRLYYWFDQEGNNMQNKENEEKVTASTKQPLAIGKRDDLPELTEKVKEFCSDPHIQEIYNNFPSQAEVDRNLEKNVPDPQPIITHKGGYTIMNKAYVKYEVPVRMGNTYYFFSNDSKVGFAGVKFEPAENQPTATLAMTQNDDWSVEKSQSNAYGMAQHKGKSFATATLARSFKKDQWNTICLPFSVSEKQVEEVFGVGTELLIYDGIKEIEGQRVAQFLRHVDQNILAGQPYFIYTTGVNARQTDTDGNISSLEFHNITVPANLHVRSYGNDDSTDGLRMVGTLSQTAVQQYDYYVNAKSGEITRYTGAGTTLNTYRAFLQQTDSSPMSTFMFGFTDIEAEAEGVETKLMPVVSELGIGKQLSDGIYNLNGQKLGEASEPGIYIVNGKKIINK